MSKNNVRRSVTVRSAARLVSTAIVGTAIIALLGASGCNAFPRPGSLNAIGSLEPNQDYEAQLSLARLSERHGQQPDARRIYEAVLREKPDNQLAHHRLAVLAAQGGDYGLAENHFQQAMSSGKPNAELLQDHGYLLYLQENHAGAEALTRQALAMAPESEVARNNLGVILGEQGDVEGSRNEFRRVTGEAESHANMGYVYAMNGDLDSAEKELHRALDMDPTLEPAAVALLQLHERRGGRARGIRAPNNAPSGPARASATQVSTRIEDRPRQGRAAQNSGAAARGSAAEHNRHSLSSNSPELAGAANTQGVVPATGNRSNIGPQHDSIRLIQHMAPMNQPWQVPTWTADNARSAEQIGGPMQQAPPRAR